MDLIASGMSNQQIAATCFISEKTVKNHINRIFTKLHSTTRSEAIARWLGTAPATPDGTHDRPDAERAGDGPDTQPVHGEAPLGPEMGPRTL